MKEFRELAIGLVIIILFSLFIVKYSHGAEFPSYQYVEISDLANNADKWNTEEVQIKGKIHDINEYTGVYGGEYIGLTMSDGITVFFYAKTGISALAIGDIILVDGRFHKFSKFGGYGYNMFITTHHLQRLE
jgi:hypothetical protein